MYIAPPNSVAELLSNVLNNISHEDLWTELIMLMAAPFEEYTFLVKKLLLRKTCTQNSEKKAPILDLEISEERRTSRKPELLNVLFRTTIELEITKIKFPLNKKESKFVK